MALAALKRLIKVQSAKAAAVIPPGLRVYAIGDIHGRLDLLDNLVNLIEADEQRRASAETLIIFLGDLIDRGPDSAGVVTRALQLAKGARNVRFLMGNHEDVFLAALDGREGAMRLLTRIGGRETFLSYGISNQQYQDADYDDLVDLARVHVPIEHRSFMRAFEDQIEIGDYLFVHAGIQPEVRLNEQVPADLRWIREPFLSYRGIHDRIVVHGHTVSEQVEERANRIGIDTGAFSRGRLTALALEGGSRWYLTSISSVG